MMGSRNLREFLEALTWCLRNGWQYTHGVPSETHWQKIVARGRAMHLLQRTYPGLYGRRIERLHLIRGNRETCILHHACELYSSGNWSVWMDEYVHYNNSRTPFNSLRHPAHKI